MNGQRIWTGVFSPTTETEEDVERHRRGRGDVEGHVTLNALVYRFGFLRNTLFDRTTPKLGTPTLTLPTFPQENGDRPDHGPR